MADGKLTVNSRVFEIDLLRGCAIVLMVLFHFAYDLSQFNWASLNTSTDIEWQIFRRIIVTGFLLAVGMSSYLAYGNGVHQAKLTKSVLKLSLVAGLITGGSVFMYPNSWVYFGIIHFIALALPISILFVRTPKVALITGLLIQTAYWFGVLNMDLLWQWSVEHLHIPLTTTDSVSFFPWIGVVLIGIFVMQRNIFGLQITPSLVGNALAWLGQHSLLIYLIHQPIMYAGFLLLEQILGRQS
jgi:uncharacterized membrane protein